MPMGMPIAPGQNMPPSGMMLTPEMVQQMGQQQGQGMSQSASGFPGMMVGGSQGTSNPSQPQGIGMMGITQEMLNNMPAAQRQILMQQLQMQGGKGMGFGGVGMPPKKEDDKK